MPRTLFSGKRSFFRRFLAGLLALSACLFSGGLPARAENPDPSLLLVDDAVEDQSRAEDVIDFMSLHDKICQLFFVAPEQFSREARVTKPARSFLRAFSRYPVGGVILFAPNIVKKDIARLNAGMQEAARGVNGIGLFIGVDEEGGSVSRVANRLQLPEKQPAPSQTGTEEQALASGLAIGEYLSRYGFNLDFAPVADVRSDVPGAEIFFRSYGSDPEAVSRMAVSFSRGLREHGVIPVLKHFPGHGAVSGNTHTGSGVSERTPEDWRKADFLPFAAGIRADAEMIMVSHQLAVRVDPDLPASLSPAVIRLLREELGFEGVIITDALRMDAVHDRFGAGEACVLALEAGADMLLLPYNFTAAYEAVMQAVKDGRLTEERIDESLSRILTLKEKYGLLPAVPREQAP